MSGGFMILGPTRWAKDAKAKSRLRDTEAPLATRRRLARFLDDPASDAVLMEDASERPKETHTRRFLRLIEERDVQTFLVYWPLGAGLHGLEQELGRLMEWLERRQLAPEQVIILSEDGNLRDDPETGVTSISEPGNRTRYHGDLIAHGCPIRVWDSPRSLELHALGALIEHARRRRRDWFAHLTDPTA